MYAIILYASRSDSDLTSQSSTVVVVVTKPQVVVPLTVVVLLTVVVRVSSLHDCITNPYAPPPNNSANTNPIADQTIAPTKNRSRIMNTKPMTRLRMPTITKAIDAVEMSPTIVPRSLVTAPAALDSDKLLAAPAAAAPRAPAAAAPILRTHMGPTSENSSPAKGTQYCGSSLQMDRGSAWKENNGCRNERFWIPRSQSHFITGYQDSVGAGWYL
mmetsp:Transcript_10783/g.26427  ORF Transcript_10783/g.26427 Transcript_10783/m.26427 type:complete len:215 (-) Transcript_10783:845-1489(-)